VASALDPALRGEGLPRPCPAYPGFEVSATLTWSKRPSTTRSEVVTYSFRYGLLFMSSDRTLKLPGSPPQPTRAPPPPYLRGDVVRLCAVVYVYRRHSILTMNNTAWQEARKRAGLPLRAAGVTFEDRQDLLGHRSGRITTHYSAAELANLIKAANRVCEGGSRKTPALVILKKQAPAAVATSA